MTALSLLTIIINSITMVPLLMFMTGKATAIRPIAVRETGISRHHVGRIKGLLKHLGLSQHYHIEGFKGGRSRPPLWRGTPASRTADVNLPVWDYCKKISSGYLYM